LLALSLADWRHFLLPDAITLPLLPLGLAAASWLEPGTADVLLAHLAAAVAVSLLLLTLRWGYLRLRDREGLGLGDVKLAAAGGARAAPADGAVSFQ